jgi:predicted ATP-dependent Lon-type protease
VEPRYFCNLTGAPYLYFELKQVANLALTGLSPGIIRAKIKDENLFQSATNKSNNKLLRATLKRVAVLDEIATVPPELFAKFQMAFYQSPEDAVFKALGVE